MKHYVVVIGDDHHETETLGCTNENDQQRVAAGERKKGHSILFLTAERDLVDVDGPYGPVKIDPTLAQSRKMAEDLDACPTECHDVKSLIDQAETILKNGDQCVSVEAKVGALRHAMALMTEALFIATSPARG